MKLPVCFIDRNLPQEESDDTGSGCVETSVAEAEASNSKRRRDPVLPSCNPRSNGAGLGLVFFSLEEIGAVAGRAPSFFGNGVTRIVCVYVEGRSNDAYFFVFLGDECMSGYTELVNVRLSDDGEGGGEENDRKEGESGNASSCWFDLGSQSVVGVVATCASSEVQ